MPHQHVVAGGGVERLALADEDVRLRHAVDGVGPDEAVAALDAAIDADGVADLLGELERAVTATDEAAFVEKRANGLAERRVVSPAMPSFFARCFGLSGW